MEKRYAIVRVQYDNCPIKYMIPKTYKNRCILHNKNCEQCRRNGDTKEQLIRKVAQVIKRVTNDGYVVAYKKFGTGYINTALNIKDVAKEIVEFLGVEE